MTRPEIESRLRELVRETKRLRKQLRGPRTHIKTAKQLKQLRRAEQEVPDLQLWWDVINRAKDMCELCGKWGANEPHHLLGGSGRRRQEQTVENVMAVHRGCHDSFHRAPWEFKDRVKAWCEKHGYPLPNRREYREGERARIEGRGRP